MALKGSTKRKVEKVDDSAGEEENAVTPVTPKKRVRASGARKTAKASPSELDTPTKATPRRAPRKPKETGPKYGLLESEGGVGAPVDVKFEGEIAQAVSQTQGGFALKLLLEAPGCFTLIKTDLIDEGKYQGLQAILIQPSKALDFMNLPKVARDRVYDFYFASRNIVGDPISIDTKAPDKDYFSKSYSDGKKNRVGLLAASTKIYQEARPVLYNRCIRFESTTSLLDFLAQIKGDVIKHLLEIEVNHYIKHTARTCLCFLAEATNLQKLKLTNGVAGEADPKKAAKAFDAEAHKFLQAMSVARHNDPVAAVDMIEFGREALFDKAEGNALWSAAKIAEFKAELVSKLKPQH